jgi:hypothetical protein
MTTDPQDPAYMTPDEEGLTGPQRYERYLDRCQDAAAALELVLDDPFLGTYDKQITALRDALRWIDFDTTCGDCVEGRCHWGGEKSRTSLAEAQQGREYEDPTYGTCGCARHDESVRVRERNRRWDAAAETRAAAAAAS